jgi:hypothetical protein
MGCPQKNYCQDLNTVCRIVYSGSNALLPANREIKVPGLNYFYSLADHHFFIMKLNIIRIRLLNYFGGYKNVDVDDYYDVTP